VSRRKKKKTSSKCPEPFNTLIDLAAAATMDYIFYKRTEDHSLKKGERVIVPDLNSGEQTTGVVLSVEHHMRFSVPRPIEKTFEIIGRA
jgi:hypothetical protein